MLFTNLLKRFLRTGTIVLISPDGQSERIAVTEAPHITIRLKRTHLDWKLLVAPSFFLPEGYVTGDLLIEDGDLRQLLTVLMSAIPDDRQPTPFDKLRKGTALILDRLAGIGNLKESKKSAQYHYDLSNDFFALFLDRNMQYSCAYFERGDETLDNAQIAKLRHIAAKLTLRSGHKVLDIGSGWGGLALFLNRAYGVQVTGITLSENQLEYSNCNVKSDDVRFYLRDYRQDTSTYDRIISVGMLEHVGRHHYYTYFSKINNLLVEDGVALIHTIGRRGPPVPINPWIRRRIFPGAYLPSLSQLVAAIERAGLWVLDCENLRFHYAKTLNYWLAALQRHKKDIESMRGEHFYRAWAFYLTSCELGFIHQGLTVYQILVSKKPDAVPLTREFIYREENRLQHSMVKLPDLVARDYAE